MLWLRIGLFVSAFVAAFLVWVPRWILAATGEPRSVSGPARGAAIVLFGCGIALMLWCWEEFGTRGRGTPAPFDPPQRLIVRGPYRYVRNPMYLAALLVLVGQSVLFSSLPLLAYAAAFGMVVHLLVVLYEERTLVSRFGASYDAYRAAVGRWVPRRTRLRHTTQ
jgi:protein-S-isoprenylcysteine O-methyltransferase Ste14